MENEMEDEYFIGSLTGNLFGADSLNELSESLTKRMCLKFSRIPGLADWAGESADFLGLAYGNDEFKVDSVLEFLGIEQDGRFHILLSKKFCSQVPEITVNEHREAILCKLSSLLEGDTLASEYLLLNLISRIQSRKDGLVDSLQIGRFSLNITNLKDKTNLLLFIESLVEKCVRISLDLKSLNEKALYPKYDSDSDSLETGKIQVSDETLLVIDEFQLSDGKLEEQGVKNVAALMNLAKRQFIPFDFKYSKVEIPCDVPVLILSEGKSIVETDCVLKIKDSEKNSPTETIGIEVLRKCILKMRSIAPVIGQELAHKLEDEFVRLRTLDSSYSDQKFSFDLGLLRLVACSYGECDITLDHWNIVQRMETERLSR